MFNIIVRTSNRPKAFSKCIGSIASQTNTNYRVIVGSDANDSYCAKYNPVKYKPVPRTGTERIGKARFFPYNEYLNHLFAKVNNGWVIVLDDDDAFTIRGALAEIRKHCTHEDNFILWKVNVGNIIIPHQINQRPKARDISMIGFCFHSKYLPLIHVAPYKHADFRIANLLYDICKPIWIDKILTKTQGNEGMGNRIDLE